jgi:excisionase family DNA binding protein
MAALDVGGVKYFDVPEIVGSMGVRTSTVRRWIRQGRLKGHKVGRKYYVSSVELKRYIERCPVAGAG